MANLTEIEEYTSGVYQIETTDPVLGGADGITNVPLKALANRTKYLKKHVDDLEVAVEDAVTLADVQAEIAKFSFKEPVRAASTTNLTLSGTQTIDGVALLVGERILVKNQSTASQNGIYVVQSSAWTRAEDMNADSEVRAGMAVIVTAGTSQAETLWVLTTDGTIAIGSTALAFANLIGSYVPTAGGTITGTLIVNTDLRVGTSSAPAAGHIARFSTFIQANGFSVNTVGTSGMYSTVANTIQFQTQGVERVRIDDDGDTGFGATPGSYGESAKVVINGSGKTNGLYINFNGNGADRQIQLNNGNGAVGYIGTDNTAMTLGTAGVERLRIASDGNITASATPAQFDDDTSVATTAFVQRALGNYSGFTGFTTNSSLTAAHAGQVIYASSSSGAITLTLPAASVLKAGAAFDIVNTGVSDVIISRAGSDTIVVDNTTNTVTSVTLKSGHTIKIVSLGSGTLWYHAGGSAQALAGGDRTLQLATAIATTSGTAHDFTSIPSWVNRIVIMLDGVSTNGTSLVQVQIGSVSFETSGYVGAYKQEGTAGTAYTTGMILGGYGAPNLRSGAFTLTRMTGNKWVISGAMGLSNANVTGATGGVKSISGTLDRLRLTTINGTDAFDAGSVNIAWEA